MCGLAFLVATSGGTEFVPQCLSGIVESAAPMASENGKARETQRIEKKTRNTDGSTTPAQNAYMNIAISSDKQL